MAIGSQDDRYEEQPAGRQSFLQRFFATPADAAALVLRLALGGVMFPHGAQKVFGWFGGNGFTGTLQHFSENLSIPTPLGVVAILTEFLGSIALVFGLCTRLAALGIGIEMVVAALMVHVQYGFFMNWHGKQEGEGIEYHILAVAMALALVIRGGGLFSVDRAIAGTMRR